MSICQIGCFPGSVSRGSSLSCFSYWNKLFVLFAELEMPLGFAPSFIGPLTFFSSEILINNIGFFLCYKSGMIDASSFRSSL